MPFYRYACKTCGEEFRVLQPVGCTEPTTCPACGGRDTERLLPRVAVQFKGSGYYKTDRDPKRSKAGTKSATKSGSDSSSSGSEKGSSGDSRSSSDSSSKPAGTSND